MTPRYNQHHIWTLSSKAKSLTKDIQEFSIA